MDIMRYSLHVKMSLNLNHIPFRHGCEHSDKTLKMKDSVSHPFFLILSWQAHPRIIFPKTSV